MTLLLLSDFFGLLGGLLVLAFVANRLSRRTRVPDVVVLLVCGILLGPVLQWVHAAQFPELIRGVGMLALILILFAAGLELNLRRAVKQFVAGTVLAILSYALTLISVAYFFRHWMGLPFTTSLLAAAPLACISGSIVLPILDQLDLRHELKTLLVIEAAFGDGLGALGVSVLLGLAQDHHAPSRSGGEILGGVFASFVFQFLLAFVIGVVAGVLWVKLLPHISDKQFWQVLTFAAVLIVYSATHAVGGSDLFAVIVFGATLANLLDPKNSLQEFGFESMAVTQSSQIHSFHSELAFLVRSFFFVLLGAMISFNGLKRQLLPAIAVLICLLAVRFLAVSGSLVAWRGSTWRDRELAMLLIPRGLITAVLTFEVVQVMPVELSFLPALTFCLILFTSGLLLVVSIRARSVDRERSLTTS